MKPSPALSQRERGLFLVLTRPVQLTWLSQRERTTEAGMERSAMTEEKAETVEDSVSPHPNPLPEGEGTRRDSQRERGLFFVQTQF